MKTARSSALMAVAATAATALLVTACTSSHSEASKTSASSAGVVTGSTRPAGVSSAGVAAQHSVPAVASLPTPGHNDISLFKQVTTQSCQAVAGGWQVRGMAHNPAATARKYDILVYFTTPQATVINYSSAAITVAPGTTAPWTASKKFATEPGMRCVVVSVR
jgi:hypothetical protein